LKPVAVVQILKRAADDQVVVDFHFEEVFAHPKEVRDSQVTEAGMHAAYAMGQVEKEVLQAVSEVETAADEVCGRVGADVANDGVVIAAAGIMKGAGCYVMVDVGEHLVAA
jgi:hypothetical protein